jgi:hypothetical protein
LRQISLDQVADPGAAAQEAGQLAGVATELQGERKSAPDVVEPLHKAVGRGPNEKIDLGKPRRRARPPHAQGGPIEHRRLRAALYRSGHSLYMVGGAAGRQRPALRKYRKKSLMDLALPARCG